MVWPEARRRVSFAILVPYRNREAYLEILLAELPTYLEKANSLHDYTIYVAEQLSDDPFNLSLSRNVAARAALDDGGFDYFVFHDVDIIPVSGIDYGPRDFDVAWFLSAGSCKVKVKDFIAANGYNTEFVGWGNEDTEFYHRLGVTGACVKEWHRLAESRAAVAMNLEWPELSAEEARRWSASYFAHGGHGPHFVPYDRSDAGRALPLYDKSRDFLREEHRARNQALWQRVHSLPARAKLDYFKNHGLNRVNIGSAVRLAHGRVRRVQYRTHDVLKERARTRDRTTTRRGQGSSKLHEYAILVPYYGGADRAVLAQNLRRLRHYNPEAPIIPLLHDGEPFVEGTIDVRRYPCPWKTEDKWRSCDTMIYRWFPRRTIRAKRYVLCEWDTYSTTSIPAFYAQVWNADVAAVEAFPRAEKPDWWSFKEVKSLGHLAPFASGVVPFSGTLFSEKALEAICRGPVIADAFCELRVATLAAHAGLQLTSMPFARDFISFDARAIRVSDAPGIYHPVKRLVDHAPPISPRNAPLVCEAAVEVANRLVRARGGSLVLELTMAGGGRPGLEVAHHHVVSQGSRATYRMTSKAFFESWLGAPRYDLILIEPSDDAAQTLRDVECAMARLAAHGAIVVRDVSPTLDGAENLGDSPASSASTGSRPAADGKPSEAQKAVERFRAKYPHVEVLLVNAGSNCAVIRPSVRPRDEPGPPAFDEDGEPAGAVTLEAFERSLLHLEAALARKPIASRTDVINALVSRHGLTSYLEIGLGDPRENFDRVVAPQRHSVDPAGSSTFRMTSDEFFAQRLGLPRYDLVFIDSFHEEALCLRDIESSLERLTSRGFIVVHDANPPSEWHQRPPSDYHGGQWNGTVWKAIVRFRERRPECAIFTVDVDWGCAVIRPSGGVDGIPSAVTPSGLTWTGLEKHRKHWLNLVSVDDFRAMLRDSAGARSFCASSGSPAVSGVDQPRPGGSAPASNAFNSSFVRCSRPAAVSASLPRK